MFHHKQNCHVVIKRKHICSLWLPFIKTMPFFFCSFLFFVHSGWRRRAGRSRRGRSSGSNGETLYLRDILFLLSENLSYLAHHALLIGSLMHLFDSLVVLGASGNSWSHRNDGSQGRDSECCCDFSACGACHLSWITCKDRVNSIINNKI